MRTRVLAALATVVALAGGGAAQPIVDVDMVIGASGENGGQLLIGHDFSQPILATFSVSADGLTRWTSTQPGFDAVDPLKEARPGFHPVRAGTPIRVELVAADPGASFKLGAGVLDVPGASAFLANAPDLHLHGEWRLVLPDGVVGAFQIALRLVSTSPAYRPSPPYVFVLVNDPGVPIPTTTLPGGSGGGDQPLAGTTLLLRAGKRDAKRSLALRVRDAALAVPAAGDAGDPSQAGGTLRVVAGGVDATYPLPAAGWSARKGGRVWRYADPRGAAGPVRAVTLTAGKGLQLAARGAGLALDLTATPEPVAVTLSLGSQRFCLAFGGATTWKPAKSWKARNAAAPAACTP